MKPEPCQRPVRRVRAADLPPPLTTTPHVILCQSDNNLNPKFKTKIEMDYMFEEVQDLQVTTTSTTLLCGPFPVPRTMTASCSMPCIL